MGIIARQSIKGTLVTYIGVAVGFFTTFFVLTRFLTSEEIGLARVLIDTATLFIGLAQLGSGSSMIRFFPYFKSPTEQDRSYHGFFFWSIIIPLLGFIVLSLIYVLTKAPLSALFQDKSPLFVSYYYAILPLALFMLYQTIFETGANVLMRIVLPRAVRELFLRIFLLAAYLLYAFRYVSMNGFVALLCGAYGLAALINLIYLVHGGHISFRPDFHYIDRALAKRYLLYTLFQITSAVVTVLAPTISSFFITAQMGLSYTGIFAIATYIATMVSIPNRSLNSIANPQLAQAIKDKDRSSLQHLLGQISSNSFLVGSFIFAAIWLNIDLLFAILPNGETYAVARNTVLILMLTQLIVATLSATLSVLNYSRYYALSLIFSLLLTLSVILLNNRLLPLLGMNGAALSNLLSYSGYYLLITLVMAIALRVHPFARGHILTLLLLGLMLAAGWLIDSYLPTDNIWLLSLCKTTLWAMAGVAALRMKISPEINALLPIF